MSVKQIIKGANYLLFSNTLALLGFLVNLGLITITYIVIFIIDGYIYSLERLSFLNFLNIFSVTYLILAGITWKWAVGKNDKFNSGFILSGIFVALIIIGTYIREFLRISGI
ncbi:MAG: hypothetical protein WDZ69_02440 [Candidatus Pacearchaeota archaeon]